MGSFQLKRFDDPIDPHGIDILEKALLKTEMPPSFFFFNPTCLL